ncbi:hypothetical protein V8G69_07485 [Gaetbulibacter sp. M235]|uniref:hypothetical protein n=1 Tax=Gaetbulibacter sp. M235 TaxID=3126510 RepID=UPI00374E6D66
MKTIYLVIVAFLVTPLFSFTSLKINEPILANQDITIVEAVYDGHEDYGYIFIAKHSDDEEYTLTFQKVDEAVSVEFDLDSDALIGTKFRITYRTKTIVTKDADGYEDETIVNTITKLEKL